MIFLVIKSYVFDLISTLIYTFIVVIILLWLTPKFVDRVGSMSVGKACTSLGIGAGITFIGIPVAFILGIILLITIIGLPIAATLFLLFAILYSISFSITSIYFAKLFTKSKELGKIKFSLITLAVAACLWILSQIPFIGWLAGLAATLFGSGATIVNIVPIPINTDSPYPPMELDKNANKKNIMNGTSK